MTKQQEELLDKLTQIEQHARASVGEDIRLVADRMKFIAQLSRYLRTQLRLSWSQDFDTTLPIDSIARDASQH